MKHSISLSALLLVTIFYALLGVDAFARSDVPIASESDPSRYERQATWAETMVRNRATALQGTSPEGVEIGDWFAVPAMNAESLEDSFFPEDYIDADTGVNESAGAQWPHNLEGPHRRQNIDFSMKDDKARSIWKKQSALFDGVVNRMSLGGNQTIYLTRTVTVDEAQEIEIGLGYDDAMSLWINGERVAHRPGLSGVIPNSVRVNASFNTGENLILMKIFNAHGGSGFYFGMAGTGVSPTNIWDEIQRDYPEMSANFLSHYKNVGKLYPWFDAEGTTAAEVRIIKAELKSFGEYGAPYTARLAALQDARLPGNDPAWLQLFEDVCMIRSSVGALKTLDTAALRRGIEALAEAYPESCPNASQHLILADAFEHEISALTEQLLTLNPAAPENIREALARFDTLKREALLANPLLDFDRIMLIRRNLGSQARKAMGSQLGFPTLNSHTMDTVRHTGWDNEIAVMTNLRDEPQLETFYKPDGGLIVAQFDIEFSGERVMFSSIGANDRWALFEVDASLQGYAASNNRTTINGGIDINKFEVDAEGKNVLQLTPDDLPDVDFFDSCYLPDGRIAATSTAPYQGLPCEYGGKPMASLYLIDPESQKIRRMTYEQDSDWSPTVLNNGRLLYQRWEYTDTPHYFTRVLFHSNPDGTGQMEYYGSNSYFPNSFFFARPIPNDSSKVVGIVTGHHGLSRTGRLMILDPALGRSEATGVVQEIPGFGQEVQPIVLDRLVDNVWPQFTTPYPLSDEYFLVSAKLHADALWGIYLVDIYDNITLIQEIEGEALLEPVPFRATERPPMIADRVIPTETEATVFLTDIYRGPGLAGIPRGTVKNLRLISYHYAYIKSGGHTSVGVESSWDIKRILGTVPVEEDGSASFRIPANTPIALQPLDAEGRALQLMRSWMVGMPGELVSCVGCHESQNAVTPNILTLAARRAPSTIEPWYGPARPFGFFHEVQPVLDRYCVGCHNGSTREDRLEIPVFTAEIDEPDYLNAGSYMALQPYVRRPGPESDYHLTTPMEYHASVSELIQMLTKGHNGVELNQEAWERLYTWIDLNAPYRARWDPIDWRENDQVTRRLELAALYEYFDADPTVLGYATSNARSTINGGIGIKSFEPINPEEEYYETASAFAELQRPVFDADAAINGGADMKGLERLQNFIQPAPVPAPSPAPVVANWPFDSESARTMQADLANHLNLANQTNLTLVIGYASTTTNVDTTQPINQAMPLTYQFSETETEECAPVELSLTLIPAGRFAMGSNDGALDEQPVHDAVVNSPFWMTTMEITNRQYALFNPFHDSKYQDMGGKDHSARGFALNTPDQPVVRVSWDEATVYCDWLSEATGLRVTLPTETQWEWACRAGTDTPLNYGTIDVNFSQLANFADRASASGKVPVFVRTTTSFLMPTSPLINVRALEAAQPQRVASASINDGQRNSAPGGLYPPNAWGLYDMHGNVGEWTRSEYRSYTEGSLEHQERNPATFSAATSLQASVESRRAGAPRSQVIVRGGSWRERPQRGTSSFRIPYLPYQKPQDVGFRVIIEQ